MVSTLEESGSDFVVGSLQQLEGGELVEPEFIKRGVQERRIGVQAADVPAIIRNVFAWNKVFRRSFYERAGIRFPEGVRYEDQPAIMRAYLSAERFDILRRPVYIWRIRGDGTSITDGRGDIADLEDRLTTKRMTSEVVRTLGNEQIRDFWGHLALVGDLSVYFKQIPGADEAYWNRLVSGLRELLDGYPPIHRSWLRLPQRLLGWLVVQDRRDDAERVLRWMEENPGPLSLTVEADHVIATGLPVASDPGSDVPDELRRLGEHELEFDARLVEVTWEDSALLVTGWAVVRGAPTSGTRTEVRAWLRSDRPGTEVSVPATVSRFPAPEATAWIDRGDQNYDDCGFVARFDLGEWLALPPPRRDELVLDLEVDVEQVHGRGRPRSLASDARLCGQDPTSSARPDWRPGAGLYVVPG
jgi:hypothetical protein